MTPLPEVQALVKRLDIWRRNVESPAPSVEERDAIRLLLECRLYVLYKASRHDLYWRDAHEIIERIDSLATTAAAGEGKAQNAGAAEVTRALRPDQTSRESVAPAPIWDQLAQIGREIPPPSETLVARLLAQAVDPNVTVESLRVAIEQVAAYGRERIAELTEQMDEWHSLYLGEKTVREKAEARAGEMERARTAAQTDANQRQRDAIKGWLPVAATAKGGDSAE